jgi:hypothetical protein
MTWTKWTIHHVGLKKGAPEEARWGGGGEIWSTLTSGTPIADRHSFPFHVFKVAYHVTVASKVQYTHSWPICPVCTQNIINISNIWPDIWKYSTEWLKNRTQQTKNHTQDTIKQYSWRFMRCPSISDRSSVFWISFPMDF